MPQIFSKKANKLPHLSLGGALFGGVLTILVAWYYLSPEYTDVGYAPEQPGPYSHRLHVGQLGGHFIVRVDNDDQLSGRRRTSENHADGGKTERTPHSSSTRSPVPP